jgi:DNA-binding XRE family transcriptional regulator
MKTKVKPRTPFIADRVTVNGKHMVMLEEAEFDWLLREADLWEPKMPEADANGNYPAVETALTTIAIDIIRDRRRLGLTQAELARRAGIRLTTLQRIESGERRPINVRAIDKIDKVLKAAEKKAAKA